MKYVIRCISPSPYNFNLDGVQKTSRGYECLLGRSDPIIYNINEAYLELAWRAVEFPKILYLVEEYT